MKNRNKIIGISTGLAALVMILTIALSPKKTDAYVPKIDISDSKNIEHYIENYQELFENQQNLQLTDYNYYLEMYKDLISKEHYNAFTNKFTFELPNGNEVSSTEKEIEDNVIKYYNENGDLVKIIDGNKITIYSDKRNNNVLSMDENGTITININYASGNKASLTINKDNSYSLENIEGTTYYFNSDGLLYKSINTSQDKILKNYEDGDINYYTEKVNEELRTIKKKDGTNIKIFNSFLPNTLKDKLPFYNITEYVEQPDKIIVEFDENEEIKNIELTKQSKNIKYSININNDGTYYGKIKRLEDNTNNLLEITIRCDKNEEVVITENDSKNEKITRYDKYHNVIGLNKNEKELIKKEDNIVYYYDEEHNITRYYKYDGKSFIEYDKDGNIVTYYNNDTKEIKTYYTSGKIETYENDDEKKYYYESGNLSTYLCKNNEKILDIDGKAYELNSGDSVSFFESGKIKKIYREKNKVSIEYYESGRVKSYRKNGVGNAFFESGKIEAIYESQSSFREYYENGNLKFETSKDGNSRYYENGNLMYQEQNGVKKHFDESGTYGQEEEQNGLVKTYINNQIIKYENKSEKNRVITITIKDEQYKLMKNEYITIYENGMIHEIKKENSYKEYYESGKIKKEIENGNGKEYYESGEIFKEIKNNEVVKEYYENNQLKYEIADTVKKGYYESGMLKELYINGILIESFYEEGYLSYTNRIGEQRKFAKNGRVLEETIKGKKYVYDQITGNIKSITEGNHTTEYPISIDYNFHIEIDRYNDSNNNIINEYKYMYKDELLYIGNKSQPIESTYSEEYGLYSVSLSTDEGKITIFENTTDKKK